MRSTITVGVQRRIDRRGIAERGQDRYQESDGGQDADPGQDPPTGRAGTRASHRRATPLSIPATTLIIV